MRIVSCFAVFLPALVVPAAARAHIQLTSPQPRYVQDNNGLKTAPCGSGTRTGAVTKLSPGQTLTVTWKESVSHAGHYRIALAASDSEFVEPKDLGVPSPLPSWDLVDGIQDKTGTQTYSQSIRIPQAACASCVLQVIQVMSAGSDGTNTGSFSGVYHACADVSISAGNDDAGVGPEVGAADGGRTDSLSPDASSVDVRVSADGSSPGDTVTNVGGAGGHGTGGSTTTATGGMLGGGGANTGSPGAGGAKGDSGGAALGGAAGGGNGGAPGTSGDPVGGSHSGSTTPTDGGTGGSPGAVGNGGSVTARGGSGGRTTGGAGDASASPSKSGCACHMGSPGKSRVFVSLVLAGLVMALRGRLRRRN